MTIFAPSLGAIWEQLESYGLDAGPVFRKHGIDPETMYDPGARLSLETFQRLDADAASLSGDSLYGLKTADFFRPAHMGALGFAWLASSSLRAAFHRLSRYVRMLQNELEIHLDEDSEFFRIRVESEVPDFYRELNEDEQFSYLLKMCRVVAGEDFNPVQVSFMRDVPAESGAYFKLLRCPVDFNSQQTSFVVSIEDIDKRLVGSNKELAQLNEHIVIKYLAYHDRKDIVSQVKACIINGLANGQVTEQSVAEEFHTTARNLHRKLSAEDTSFMQLITEVRQALAQQYIQDRSKTLTEIAFLLGFSEASAFSRAFKSWNGIPPSEARMS